MKNKDNNNYKKKGNCDDNLRQQQCTFCTAKLKSFWGNADKKGSSEFDLDSWINVWTHENGTHCKLFKDKI